MSLRAAAGSLVGLICQLFSEVLASVRVCALGDVRKTIRGTVFYLSTTGFHLLSAHSADCPHAGPNATDDSCSKSRAPLRAGGV